MLENRRDYEAQKVEELKKLNENLEALISLLHEFKPMIPERLRQS